VLDVTRLHDVHHATDAALRAATHVAGPGCSPGGVLRGLENGVGTLGVRCRLGSPRTRPPASSSSSRACRRPSRALCCRSGSVRIEDELPTQDRAFHPQLRVVGGLRPRSPPAKGCAPGPATHVGEWERLEPIVRRPTPQPATYRAFHFGGGTRCSSERTGPTAPAGWWQPGWRPAAVRRLHRSFRCPRPPRPSRRPTPPPPARPPRTESRQAPPRCTHGCRPSTPRASTPAKAASTSRRQTTAVHGTTACT